jgi:phosphoribosyl-dephospho-CoA transferase
VIVRIHDLLEIDAQRFLEANLSALAWVVESLRATPFVVVRRGLAPPGEIAVGVRGEQRNQRWAGTCDPRWIRRIVTPAELISRMSLASPMYAQSSWDLMELRAPASPQPRSDTIPALRSLALLAHHESWKSLPHRWGPGGSVGFELATGRHTATSQSDLDLVIYADERLSVEEAKHVHVSTKSLPSAVDIRVETPFCGFSLAEYASRAPAPILLRKVSGVELGVDPWDDGSAIDTRRGDTRIDLPGSPSMHTSASHS